MLVYWNTSTGNQDYWNNQIYKGEKNEKGYKLFQTDIVCILRIDMFIVNGDILS